MHDDDGFAGFSPQTLKLLAELRSRNSKQWYLGHKAELDQKVMMPLKQFVTALAVTIEEIDDFVDTTPAVNRTISRFHRDTRFSKDKTLYKDRIWISFKRMAKDWKTRPAFFFELSPVAYRFGMGFYSASKPTMDSIRAALEDAKIQVRFRDALNFDRPEIVFEGDQYKRKLPSTAPEDLQSFVQSKNFYAIVSRKADALLFSSELAETVGDVFQQLSSLYCLLWEIVATEDDLPVLY